VSKLTFRLIFGEERHGMDEVQATGKPNVRYEGLLNAHQRNCGAVAAFSGLAFHLRTTEDAGSRLTDW
jgi:hypothetical protein